MKIKKGKRRNLEHPVLTEDSPFFAFPFLFVFFFLFVSLLVRGPCVRIDGKPRSSAFLVSTN